MVNVGKYTIHGFFMGFQNGNESSEPTIHFSGDIR